MYGVGAAFLCLEPEPTQFGRSRSRLWDLGLSEPPKKVAVPQLWYLFLTLFVPGVPNSVPGFLLYVQDAGIEPELLRPQQGVLPLSYTHQ